MKSLPRPLFVFLSFNFLLFLGTTAARSQSSFVDPNIGGFVSQVLLQPDGKILVGGSFATTGEWFRIRSTAGFDTVNWGQSGDTPIAADYDGDGKSDVAVFRPSNATWYIVGSTSGQIIQQYGQTGDLPTEGAFIY